MQKISFNSLHQTAAEYLAAAILGLFPDTFLLGGQGTARYFYYDFIFSFPLEHETLKIIEERMVQLYRQNNPLVLKEMVPSNAVAFFNSIRQKHLAQQMKELEGGLAQLCQLGHFVDYCPYPFIQSWPFKPFFTLFEILPGKRTRIIGAVFSDKNELKAFTKNLPALQRVNHSHLCTEMQLMMPLNENRWMWLPQGETLRTILLKFWRQELVKQKFQFLSSPHASPGKKTPEQLVFSHHQACFELTGQARLAEILYLSNKKHEGSANALLESAEYFTDRFTFFCDDEIFLQTCISSLQSILKMPRILGFELQIVLGSSTAKGHRSKEKRKEIYQVLRKALELSSLEYIEEIDYRPDCEAWIEIRIEDALGRLWNGPFIGVPSLSTGKGKQAFCSMFGAMERFVALLLEKTEGVLPVWLAPEQVRLVVVNKEGAIFARTLHDKLVSEGIRASIDEQPIELRASLHQTVREKVPYVICVGEKDVTASTFPVRKWGAKQEERMTLEALCEVIKTVNWEWDSELQN